MSQSEYESDLRMSLALLQGELITNRSGVNEERYYQKGSSEEQAARRALAKLLRSNNPLDRQVRSALAALIDADISGYPGDNRVFIFQPRPKTKRHNLRNTQIFEFIQRKAKSKEKVGDAIEAAAKKFGLGEEAIKKIWDERRKLDALPLENAKVTFYTRIMREG
jgi:hypothetical protein